MLTQRHRVKTIFELKPKFSALSNILAIGLPASANPSLPLEPLYRLYLVSGSGSKLIEGLDDLVDKVAISTPEAALSFVRLNTSPRTFLLLHSVKKLKDVLGIGPKLEVLSQARLDSDYVFGDVQMLDGLRRVSSGTYGILANNVQIPGLIAPQCHAAKNGFFVKRMILMHSSGSSRLSNNYTIYSVEEFVSHKGDWRIEKSNLVYKKVPEEYNLFIPTFE